MLEKMWNNLNFCRMLVGVQIGTITLENTGSITPYPKPRTCTRKYIPKINESMESTKTKHMQET